MRRVQLPRLRHLPHALGCVAALGWALSAWAQPPAHNRHGTTAAAGSLTVAMPRSAAVMAYMAGHQGLVGLHAPSTRALEADAAGRPMLAMTTVNRGESLA